MLTTNGCDGSYCSKITASNILVKGQTFPSFSLNKNFFTSFYWLHRISKILLKSSYKQKEEEWKEGAPGKSKSKGQ